MNNIIFTNYDLDFWREEAIDLYDEKEDEDIIYYHCNNLADSEWEFFLECLERYLKEHKCIAVGSIGRWNGRFEGYEEINSMNDFYDLISDCGFYELSTDDESDGLNLKCSHHDGTNYYTLFNYDNDVKSAFNMEWCL